MATESYRMFCCLILSCKSRNASISISGIVTEKISEDKLTVSIGPQHPGAGHFRFTITVEGDTIVD
ncbi:MAG: hypothetical protein M1587_11250, partial [Thaumarchaeota archaeon]|nr:hypothetical protein [Nitrososphaerota archaeon]